MKFSLFAHLERIDDDQPHDLLYQQFVELCRMADDGGMHAIWTGEHHGMEFTISPIFLAEAHFAPGALGNKAEHVEVDFYIVPGSVSMNLSAMSVCTKHGLWQSESREVTIRKG